MRADGVGYISTEWPDAPGIWSKEQVLAWKKITDTVHAAGGHIYAQVEQLGFAREISCADN